VYLPQASPRLRPNGSPGELSPTALQTIRRTSPGEVDTRSARSRARSASPNGRRVIEVTPSRQQHSSIASREDSGSRSLHKSDLQHKNWGNPLEYSREGSPPRSPTSHSSRGSERQQSPPNRPTSRGSDLQQSPPPGQRPVVRPPIHVPMPSMDQEQSSVYSRGERAGYDFGDTSGDISSISGGDF